MYIEVYNVCKKVETHSLKITPSSLQIQNLKSTFQNPNQYMKNCSVHQINDYTSIFSAPCIQLELPSDARPNQLAVLKFHCRDFGIRILVVVGRDGGFTGWKSLEFGDGVQWQMIELWAIAIQGYLASLIWVLMKLRCV